MEPTGALRNNCEFMFLRAKINAGGMNDPAAFIAQTRVVVCPFSADVTFPTCLTPFLAMTCCAVWDRAHTRFIHIVDTLGLKVMFFHGISDKIIEFSHLNFIESRDTSFQACEKTALDGDA